MHRALLLECCAQVQKEKDTPKTELKNVHPH